MAETGRRVRFLADFDYKPTPMSTIAYKKGETHFVRLAAAERAVRLGKAAPVDGDAPAASVSATIAKKSRRKKANAGE